MQWRVNEERSLYKDQSIEVRSADLVLPDGRHVDHRLIPVDPSAGAVVVNDSGRVLLLWRHRFVTDTWGYEIPLGRIEPGEEPAVAAARHVEQVSGWRPGHLGALLYLQPCADLTTAQCHIFVADSAAYVSEATDTFDSEYVEWVRLDTVAELIGKKQIVNATTVASLMTVLGRDRWR